MATNIPQVILRTMVTTLNTRPDRLSETEAALARRICTCVVCLWLWVRRRAKIPNRCPHCHSRGWDRPLLAALMNDPKLNPPDQDQSSGNSEEGGAA